MEENEENGELHNSTEGGSVRQAPCQCCEEEEEGEEICEGRVRSMPGIFGF